MIWLPVNICKSLAKTKDDRIFFCNILFSHSFYDFSLSGP